MGLRKCVPFSQQWPPRYWKRRDDNLTTLRPLATNHIDGYYLNPNEEGIIMQGKDINSDMDSTT